MKNKIAPTKAELIRFDAMQQRGCVPCWLEAKLQDRAWIPEPGDIHHVEQANSCGHHRFTYCNCPWHHRGIVKTGFTERQMRENFGPSMAKDPRAYRARYGSETDLLVYQNSLLLKSPPRTSL